MDCELAICNNCRNHGTHSVGEARAHNVLTLREGFPKHLRCELDASTFCIFGTTISSVFSEKPTLYIAKWLKCEPHFTLNILRSVCYLTENEMVFVARLVCICHTF